MAGRVGGDDDGAVTGRPDSVRDDWPMMSSLFRRIQICSSAVKWRRLILSGKLRNHSASSRVTDRSYVELRCNFRCLLSWCHALDEWSDLRSVVMFGLSYVLLLLLQARSHLQMPIMRTVRTKARQSRGRCRRFEGLFRRGKSESICGQVIALACLHVDAYMRIGP